FHRETAAASLAAVLEYEVDPDPRIDPRLWLAISRALAKRPYERYATCNEFADAIRMAIGATDDELGQALHELRPKHVPSITGSTPRSFSASKPRGSQALRRGRLGPVGLALVLAAVFAIGVGVALLATRGNESSARAAPMARSASPSALPASSPTSLQPT